MSYYELRDHPAGLDEINRKNYWGPYPYEGGYTSRSGYRLEMPISDVRDVSITLSSTLPNWVKIGDYSPDPTRYIVKPKKGPSWFSLHTLCMWQFRPRSITIINTGERHTDRLNPHGPFMSSEEMAAVMGLSYSIDLDGKTYYKSIL